MKIRIGTRSSPLALWQAHLVKQKIEKFSDALVEVVPISSDGDSNQTQPIYNLGITGVFTRALDIALLEDQIDIAVHSLKDIPTQLAKGIELSAVLERDFNQDVLVYDSDEDWTEENWEGATIATGSLRRRAFILNKYPNVNFMDIRGNVQTRLKKMKENSCEGTILSLAGLERMTIPVKYISLDFMFPSVGQGVVAIASRKEAPQNLKGVLSKLNHEPTHQSIKLERSFLETLEGGCTAPIGARTEIVNSKIKFSGALLSLDGTERLDVSDALTIENTEEKGKLLAEKILKMGGDELMQSINKDIQQITGG